MSKMPKSPAAHEVCPPWLCWTFDNPFRRLLQNPDRILKPYIKPGMTALDVGPGKGYFTIPMAKLVGAQGNVIAADLQQAMLDGVDRRAFKAGVQKRIKLQLVKPDSLGITSPVDFALTFWMVHEVPDRSKLINEIATSLKKDGLFLIAEPRIHVSRENFNDTLKIAKAVGLTVAGNPQIFLSYTALLKK